MRILPLMLLWVLPLQAQQPLELRATLVHFAGGRWPEPEIESVAVQAGKILAQCGIAPGKMTLLRVDVEPHFRIFHTPASRELLRSLRVDKPAVFFVDDSRERPAFDAEAIGRGNSRRRPELADTVWMTRAARDPAITLAHELAHVLMDSGEHSDEPGNLMREETEPENTQLSAAQCARLRATAAANGLLQQQR